MSPLSTKGAPSTRQLSYPLIWAPWPPIAVAVALTMDSAQPTRVLLLAGLWLVLGFILGYPVWRWYSRHTLPFDSSPAVVAVHFLAAVAFAVVWTVLQYLLNPLRSRPLFEAMSMSRTTVWQMIAGGWVYATLAGLAYASQMRLRAVRAESLALQARFEALRARLNPHFLFNTLHTLGALARHDADRTETAIGELGELLRYTLRDQPSDLVTLREEWEFTQKYLAFEQLRLEARLRVESNVSAVALGCRVPAFALQTVVENAIRHGVTPNSEGGTVRIEATCVSGKLNIGVEDTGAGSRIGADESAGMGSGLSALSERLRLHFGDNATLTATPIPPAGYRVMMSMPMDVARSGGR